jgi:hypothetical protein
MKPSTIRYIRNEQDVWAILWRIIPRACKELMRSRLPRSYSSQQQQSINHIDIQFPSSNETQQIVIIKHD